MYVKKNAVEELISVIVPIYRVEKYLEECVQSIRSQTYKNLEIILVDDGSDDGCSKICDRHALEDKRIKVIHKENGGLDSARKAGMLVATGKYIGYVDGDDWIEPNMYERLLNYANRYNVEVVESGAIDSYIDEEKKRVPYLAEGCYKDKDFIQKVEPYLLYAGDFFEHGVSPYMWSKLFLREKVMKYQMIDDVTNVIQDDTMVALPCIADTKSIYISHDCYYHYRVRNDSLKREIRQDEVAILFECYSELYNRFKGTKLYSAEDRQIKYFVMYWLIFKAPYVFDKLCTDNILMPFGKIKVKDKIVLYGAGAAGIHIENYVRNIENSNIVCWVDRNYKTLQYSLNVRNPEDIINYEFDYVIITIMRARVVQSVKKDLVNLGVPKDKILWIEQKYIDNPELLLEKVLYQGKSLI